MVAGCFGALMLLGLGFAYFVPSLEENCVKACKIEGKVGQLVPIYPASMTGPRGSQKTCECH